MNNKPTIRSIRKHIVLKPKHHSMLNEISNADYVNPSQKIRNLIVDDYRKYELQKMNLPEILSA